MYNKMEAVFRKEVRRLARKEVKAAVEPLRQEIVRLKATQRQLRRTVAREVGREPSKPPAFALPKPADTDSARIGPRWIRAMRKRHRISQQQLADILGVSMSAVGSWEYSRSKPGTKNRAKLVAIRRMNRKEIESLISIANSPKKADS